MFISPSQRLLLPALVASITLSGCASMQGPGSEQEALAEQLADPEAAIDAFERASAEDPEQKLIVDALERLECPVVDDIDEHEMRDIGESRDSLFEFDGADVFGHGLLGLCGSVAGGHRRNWARDGWMDLARALCAA